MIKVKRYILTILCIFSYTGLCAQDFRLPLYNDSVPNSIASKQTEILSATDIITISHVQQPDVAIFLPAKRFATGQAIIICPGGGYWLLAYDHEGTDIAKFLNSIGVAAIVLKYRLPTAGNTRVPHMAPLQDAQRAMRLVRKNALAWNIDAGKIGIMGFSAGGHLASTLATHFDYGLKNAKDTVERISCRPDFLILIYPVISFIDSAKHKGSVDALLGKNSSRQLKEYYSNELHVNENTAPAFIVHADDDEGVSVNNSLLMYNALHKNKIAAELHIIAKGGHGFGLATGNNHLASWSNNLTLWLQAINTSK
jgi:acetyl esterase/lipase